jgi:cell division protein FtsB
MQSKSKWWKNFWKSQLLLLIALLVILACLLWPLSANLQKRSQLDKEVAQLKAELTRNEAQNSDFKKMIAYLESDQFVEEQAKLNLNLKKDGEKVVSIKELPLVESQQDLAETVMTEPAPVFSPRVRLNLWLDYFFGQS